MLHNGITWQGCEEDQDNGIVKGSLRSIEWDTRTKWWKDQYICEQMQNCKCFVLRPCSLYRCSRVVQVLL